MGYVSEPLRTKVYEDAGRTASCLDLHRRPVTPGTTDRTIPRWLEPTVVRPVDARIGIDLSQHDGSTYGPGVDVEAIREWFRDKGFGVQVEQDEYAVHWVNLTSLPSGRVVAPRYGRGDTAHEAAESAKKRYEIEQ